MSNAKTQRKFADPAGCLIAVLAAIDDVDPSVEFVEEITIWKFSEGANTDSAWGWKMLTGRVISWDGTLRESHPDRQRESVARWRQQAIQVYTEILTQFAAGSDRLFAKA